MGDRLRAAWDFDDLDATEQRFRQLLEQATTDAGRAEILTQLARVEGLRGRIPEGDRLVDEAEALADSSGAARVRVLLERGRLRRSSGDSAAALQLFEAAFGVAEEAGDDYLAGDAAHMAALAAPDQQGMFSWTERGVELAERSDEPHARYWLGPLLNNLGWARLDEGEYDAALEAFQRALEARELEPESRVEIEIARYAVAKTLRALGRPAESLELLEQAVAWTETVGKPDGWFHEELAETYAALGRDQEARDHARLAVKLLAAADASLTPDSERAARLRELVAD